MSGYEPRAGDRVRYVVEGVVVHSDPITGRVSLDGAEACYTHVNPAHVVSVEKVEPPKPPLPTTPGSVIWWMNAWVHLRGDGLWIDDNGDTVKPILIAGNPYDVIFDAGAES